MYEDLKNTENCLKLSHPSHDDKSHYKCLALAALNYVSACYRIFSPWKESPWKKGRLFYPIVEAAHNAARHGNDSDPTKDTEVVIWVSEEKVLIMIRDQGDFYSLEETKEMVEKRIRPEPTHEKSHGLGMRILYGLVDHKEGNEITVDTEENALYLIFSKSWFMYTEET